MTKEMQLQHIQRVVLESGHSSAPHCWTSLSGHIQQKHWRDFAVLVEGTGLTRRRETLTNNDQTKEKHQIKLQAGRLDCVTTLSQSGLSQGPKSPS